MEWNPRGLLIESISSKLTVGFFFCTKYSASLINLYQVTEFSPRSLPCFHWPLWMLQEHFKFLQDFFLISGVLEVIVCLSACVVVCEPTHLNHLHMSLSDCKHTSQVPYSNQLPNFFQKWDSGNQQGDNIDNIRFFLVGSGGGIFTKLIALTFCWLRGMLRTGSIWLAKSRAHVHMLEFVAVIVF